MDIIFVDQIKPIARYISHVPPSHYIVKIESFSLLAEKEDKCEFGEFEVGGYKWKLVLYPNGNKSEKVKDHISLYLAIEKTSSLSFGWEVYAVFRLFLLDQKKDKFLIVQDARGSEKRFHGLKLEWGFNHFIPLQTFHEASDGYIVKDTCVFGAEVFVKERKTSKGECLSMMNNISVKHAWKMGNFSKLEAKLQQSEVFLAGGHKWKILLHPKGIAGEAGSHLSLFLHLVDASNIAPASKIFAEYTLRILDQVNSLHLAKKKTYWFTAASTYSGWPGFVSFSSFFNPAFGCLVNDVLWMEAEVTVLGIIKGL